MKIIILKEKLQEGLDIISRIPGKNMTLPILANILLGSEKNFLALAATDLEVGVKCWFFAKIETPGTVTVPSAILSNVINFLPETSITLIGRNQDLIIEAKNFKTDIKGLPINDFPIIPDIKKEISITIPASSFCQALSQVYEIAVPSSSRPEISGIYLFLTDNLIKMVATDSFRLAEKTLFLKKNLGLKENYSFILPQKTTKEIINIFGEKNGGGNKDSELKIFLDPNQILIESLMSEIPHPKIHLVSRLIEGEYPNYQEIIPQKYDTQIILNRNEFFNQIKLASLFCGKISEIKLKIDPKKATVEISSQNPDIGQHSSSLTGQIKGKPKEVSFNYRFLLDGLLKIKSSEVALEVAERNGEAGPGVLKPIGDQSYIYVLMPLQTS